jgi:hypothetical protein
MADETATIEMIRGWLSTGFLGGNLFLLSRLVPAGLKHLKEMRQQKLAEKAEDRAGWGELIETMGAQIKALTEREHDCEQRIVSMRDDYERRMKVLSGEIEGLRRLIIMRSSVEGVELSPTVAAAAERSIGHQIRVAEEKDRLTE